MRLINFQTANRRSAGAVGPGGIVDLGARLGPEATDALSLLRSGLLDRAREIASLEQPDYTPEEIKLLNPIGRHTRYFCIGVNYPERNEEYKDGSARPQYPSIFMRSHSSFVADREPIVRPRESLQLDYEGEIVVVIGSGGRRIPQERASSHVFGYSCGNDGSIRDWLRHSKFNVTQGKNFDRSGAIGPCIVTTDEVGTGALHLSTRVNGELRQEDTSDRMLFSIPYLILYLSSFCTLEPGDAIFTGTPSGAGARLDPPRYLVPGDIVEVEVSGVGLLRNVVIDDEV